MSASGLSDPACADNAVAYATINLSGTSVVSESADNSAGSSPPTNLISEYPTSALPPSVKTKSCVLAPCSPSLSILHWYLGSFVQVDVSFFTALISSRCTVQAPKSESYSNPTDIIAVSV